MSQNGPPASQVLSAAALCRGPALRLSDLVTLALPLPRSQWQQLER